MAIEAALLEVDGTLIDANYQHALLRIARSAETTSCFLSAAHRAIGMGGDQLVPALAGEETERGRGDEIRAARDGL